jgi:hypothetical protein
MCPSEVAREHKAASNHLALNLAYMHSTAKAYPVAQAALHKALRFK